MPTDLHALHARLLERLEVASYWSTDRDNRAPQGTLLSGLAAAISAVRVELDREREAAACLPPVEEPADDDEWTPPPVETVWGRAEWETASGVIYELYVGKGDDYIARIAAQEWCAYRGPEGLDGVINRGNATSIRDAHDQAIAALRAAGSLA